MSFYGDDYAIAYAWGELNHERKDRTFKNYIATALEYISANTAGQETRRFLNCSLMDIYEPKEKTTESDISVEEIKAKQEKALKKLFAKGARK